MGAGDEPPAAGIDGAARAVVDAVERIIGGRVVRIERQPRWRPAWMIDVDRDGEVLPVHFRGTRGALDHGVYGLDHEHRVLCVLEDHGIAVPHVYGFSDDPEGIVMARVPGRANLLTVDDPLERARILDDYVTWLARIHRIGSAPFEAAGIAPPGDDLIMADFSRWEATYRAKKARPEPILEFAIGWLRRNAPAHTATATLAVGDSGQFLFDAGRVTAVIDLELAFLGDPLHDLACMRLRDLAEPLGPLGPAFARYEAEAGTRIDRRALDFHTARFALCTPMSISHVLAAPPDDVDYVRYLVWYVQFTRVALEIMAELARVPLDPPVAVQPTVNRFTDAYAVLDAALGEVEPDDPQQSFRLDVAQRLGIFLRCVDEHGPAIERTDLDDVAAVIGTRPATWRDADEQLEAFVARAMPADDAALIRLFHRRATRWQSLLDVGMRGRRHSAQPLAWTSASTVPPAG